jgi:hypothetical protein
MVKGQPNERLLEDLCIGSDFEASPYLERLNQSFLQTFRKQELRMVCYYETKMSKTAKVLDPLYLPLPY